MSKDFVHESTAEERADGKTTRQIKDAPRNAIYIWCNHHIDYPVALTRALNRRDVVVRSPSGLPERLFGIRLPVVVDHAANLPLDVIRYLKIHNERLKQDKRMRTAD